MSKRYFCSILLLFLLPAGEAPAAGLLPVSYTWEFKANLEIGEELHLTSPAGVPLDFVRSYAHIAAEWRFEKWDMWNQTWVEEAEGVIDAWGEAAAPVGAAGAKVYQYHLSKETDSYWVAADFLVKLDSAGRVRLDITRFDSSLPSRIRSSGTIVLANSSEVYGDLNGDGRLAAGDAAGLAALVAEEIQMPGDLSLLDLNHDGRLDILDVIRMRYFLKGDLDSAHSGWYRGGENSRDAWRSGQAPDAWPASRPRGGKA